MLSYDFPVRYKIVRDAHATKILGDEPDPALLEPFMEAARELPAIDTTLQGQRGGTDLCSMDGEKVLDGRIVCGNLKVSW